MPNDPRSCRDCSCSGWYVDYHPSVQGGGILVHCATCKGRGWLNADGTPLEDRQMNGWLPATWILNDAE